MLFWAEVIAVVIVGVAAGAKVQRCARFLYPYDVMTLGFLAAIAADVLLGISGIQAMWYASFLLGYITGYLVVGRTVYIMMMEIDLGGKFVSNTPIVIWNEGTSTYIQEQTNRALVRRLLFGIRHELVSNVPVDTEWKVDSKYPLFPLFSKRTVMVEDSRKTFVLEHVFWRFTARRYTTEMVIAYAGMVSKVQLSQDQDCLRRLQNQNIDLAAEINELRSRQGPMLMETAIAIEAAVAATSPINRMYNLMRRRPRTKVQRELSKDRKEVDADDCSEDAVQIQQ